MAVCDIVFTALRSGDDGLPCTRHHEDPIYHTSALAGFLIGAIIGIAIIAVASFAFFTCGFLAGLILSFLADQIASGVLQLGEAIGRSIHSTVGKILTGSDNVSTNSRPAARAVLSTVICEDHSPETWWNIVTTITGN